LALLKRERHASPSSKDLSGERYHSNLDTMITRAISTIPNALRSPVLQDVASGLMARILPGVASIVAVPVFVHTLGLERYVLAATSSTTRNPRRTRPTQVANPAMRDWTKHNFGGALH
jgi:hypothetical protein